MVDFLLTLALYTFLWGMGFFTGVHSMIVDQYRRRIAVIDFFMSAFADGKAVDPTYEAGALWAMTLTDPPDKTARTVLKNAFTTRSKADALYQLEQEAVHRVPRV